MACPVFRSVGVLGKKWAVPLLQQVGLHGGKGYNELLRRMGKISPKVLAARLSQFEAEGIITKTTINGMPLRTSYSLTSKGKELTVIINSLRAWNARHHGLVGCETRDCATCPLF